MNLLIGNTAVRLNFSSEQEALNTRAEVMVSYDELGMDGYFNWCNIVRKHAAIAKAYLKATGRPK